MRKKILAFVFAAALLVALAVPLFAGAGTASAHSPDGAEQDTPLGGQSRSHPALGNYGDALSHSQGENSLLRNPQCGAHSSPDGIHPPGNP